MRRRLELHTWGLALAAGILILASRSQAQPAAEPPARPTPITQGALDDWERGRSVSALATDIRGSRASRSRGGSWLVIPRALLFLPRMVLRYALLRPIDEILKLYRWQETPSFRLVFNSFIRSNFRSRFGLGYSSPTLFGAGDGFVVGLSYGGKDFQRHELRFEAKLGERNRLTAEALFAREGDEQFHGIGLVEENRTRFRLEEAGAGLGLRTDWSSKLRTEIGARWSRYTAEDPEDLAKGEAALTDRFDPRDVPGFGLTQDYAVVSLKNRVDLRGPVAGDAWELLLDAHADAYLHVDGSDFSTLRYGGQLNLGFPLPFRQPVLTARFRLEAAEGLGDSAVPFHLLPAIGEGDALRGYPSGRLRDRLMTVAGLEYRWPLSLYAEALLFVDTGRVFPDYGSFTLEDWKWGTGAGLRFRSKQGPLFSFQVAYSPETIELVVLTGSDLF